MKLRGEFDSLCVLFSGYRRTVRTALSSCSRADKRRAGRVLHFAVPTVQRTGRRRRSVLWKMTTCLAGIAIHVSRQGRIALKHRSLGTAATSFITKGGDTRYEPFPPGYTLDSIKPPSSWVAPEPATPDPLEYKRKPVTSAHAIDLSSNPPKLSVRDSAVISPSGTIIHGRYGELHPDTVPAGVPLEYLALLRPAAEGAAALRRLTSSASSTKGTILIYGATKPNALATLQLAASSGHAVVAVVSGDHSGKDDMVEVIKNLTEEPGTAVPEEYALVKGAFRDLVQLTAHGDSMKSTTFDPSTFLADFKQNLLDYTTTYPETLPAAVDKSVLVYRGEERGQKFFKENMDAYLSQFTKGCAPLDTQKLDRFFTKEQYALWKKKFGQQTTAVITGDDVADFAPADIVHRMMNTPEPVDASLNLSEISGESFEFVPYEFSILQQNYAPEQVKEMSTGGGPILGAVISVTPDLQSASEAVAKAGKSLRAKAEALQFLTDSQKNAFAAASSVVACAKSAGKPVLVLGGTLSGLETVEPTDADVKEALAAMAIDDYGNSRLNYFIQVYRAGDFPIYADYAIHRATEALAGPRQIIVTK